MSYPSWHSSGARPSQRGPRPAYEEWDSSPRRLYGQSHRFPRRPYGQSHFAPRPPYGDPDNDWTSSLRPPYAQSHNFPRPPFRQSPRPLYGERHRYPRPPYNETVRGASGRSHWYESGDFWEDIEDYRSDSWNPKIAEDRRDRYLRDYQRESFEATPEPSSLIEISDDVIDALKSLKQQEQLSNRDLSDEDKFFILQQWVQDMLPTWDSDRSAPVRLVNDELDTLAAKFANAIELPVKMSPEDRIHKLIVLSETILRIFRIDQHHFEKFLVAAIRKLIECRDWKKINSEVAVRLLRKVPKERESLDDSDSWYYCQDCKFTYPEGMFQCDYMYCHERFELAAALYKHEFEAHRILNATMQPLSFPCFGCEQVFPRNPIGLYKHCVATHICQSAHVKCPYGCKRLFDKKDSRFEQHVSQRHYFFCSDCCEYVHAVYSKHSALHGDLASISSSLDQAVFTKSSGTKSSRYDNDSTFTAENMSTIQSSICTKFLADESSASVLTVRELEINAKDHVYRCPSKNCIIKFPRKGFVCPDCPNIDIPKAEIFLILHNALTHGKRINGDRIKCPCCPIQIDVRNDLHLYASHLKRHICTSEHIPCNCLDNKCFKVFKCQAEVDTHCQYDKDKNEFYCDVCSLQFPKGGYKCTLCPESFISREFIPAHMHKVHGLLRSLYSPSVCPVCQTTLIDAFLLKIHASSHYCSSHPRDINMSDTKLQRWPVFLDQHSQSKHSESMFQENISHLPTDLSRQFVPPIINAAPLPPLFDAAPVIYNVCGVSHCTSCSFQCINENLACNICSRSFVNSVELIIHQDRVHQVNSSNLNLYSCPSCSFATSFALEMADHRFFHHRICGSSHSACIFNCGELFSKKQLMDDHMMSVHSMQSTEMHQASFLMVPQPVQNYSAVSSSQPSSTAPAKSNSTTSTLLNFASTLDSAGMKSFVLGLVQPLSDHACASCHETTGAAEEMYDHYVFSYCKGTVCR